MNKILLSALLGISTLATAQIQLHFDMTITNQDVIDRHIVSSVIVDENVPATVTFDGINDLVVYVIAETDGQNITVETQFLQKTDSEEFILMTEPLPIEVPNNQPGTVTVYGTENNDSLILVVTPTIIE